MQTTAVETPPRAALDLKRILKFALPTLLGISMFLFPIEVQRTITIGQMELKVPGLPIPPLDGDVTVGIGVLSDALLSLLGAAAVPVGVVLLCLSMVLTLWARLLDPRWARVPGWAEIFHVGAIWVALRVVGAVFGVMTLLQWGPEFVVGEATGSVILNDLIPVLFTFFIFALVMLPFLVDYGFMEFIGTLVRKPFRAVFRLPGRSAVDATASWMGAAPLGVLITYQQYEKGFYTQREAAVIATNFSLASVAFSLLIARFIGLDTMFVQMYFTVCVAALVAAIVMPRIPPLSLKKDVYYEEVGQQIHEDEDLSKGVLHRSLEVAVAKAEIAPGPRRIARDAAVNITDIFFGLLPLVMAIGTGALILAEYTPVFTWISYPIVPVLEWLGLPEAATAAPATLVGFADMFLPAVLLTSVESELTRFVIGCLSLTQLIYMSEVGVLILKSKIPLNFLELAGIFVMRSVLTLPIVAVIAHTLFF